MTKYVAPQEVKKITDLVGPPFEYEGTQSKAKIEQVKLMVVESFLERTRNTIDEKRKFCLEKGLTEDQANFILIKSIQNLQSLLPLPL